MSDGGNAAALLAEARAQLVDYKDRLMTRRGGAGMHHERRLLALIRLIERIDVHLAGTGASHPRGGGTSGGSTGGTSGPPGPSGGASGVSGG
ncbi:MAG: hypothetical protein WD270_02720 [Acetobacterales bacterium]